MTLERPMFPPRDSSRRGFLSLAAGASAIAVIPRAVAAPLDDSRLLELEEQIFEQYWEAHAFDDEIYRVFEIWTDEVRRLERETIEGRSALTANEQWELVKAMPASAEHTRLVSLQDAPFRKMDALIKQMFAMPAHTADGRRAKATVLLSVIMPHGWQEIDKDTDYPELMARNLLIEFIGGEPGEMLRGQFA